MGNIVDILFMDTQDAETAVNVMRVGQSGIGFSHNGVNGPYESAWTIDGKFVADFITTGTLDANLINVINLTAQRLVSESTSDEGAQSVEIANSQIEMYKTGERVFLLWCPEKAGGDRTVAMYLDEVESDGNHVGTCELSPMHFVLGGKGPYHKVSVDVNRDNGNVL